MISEDSILATTFTTSNLSSSPPSCGMKQPRTLEVIPFNGLTECAGEDEDEDDEEEEEEDDDDEGIEEAEGTSASASGGGEGNDELRRCFDGDRSSSSVHPKAKSFSFGANLNGSLNHKDQSNMNNDPALANSPPLSSSASPNNSQSRNDNRSNNSRSPYHRLSSSLGSGYDTALILTDPPTTVSSNLNNAMSPVINDILDQSSGNNCCSMPISPSSSWPISSSIQLSSPTTTNTTTISTTRPFANQPTASSTYDQSINHHQLHHNLDSIQPHHHHHQQQHQQQQHQALHDNLQKIRQTSNNTSPTANNTLHHNQDSFNNHQLLNHDNIGNHLTNNNGSLPPFCTL